MTIIDHAYMMVVISTCTQSSLAEESTKESKPHFQDETTTTPVARSSVSEVTSRHSLSSLTREKSKTEILVDRFIKLSTHIPLLTPFRSLSCSLQPFIPSLFRLHQDAGSEHADIVAYPIFLVLRYALRNPCNVSDFLWYNN